MTSSIFNRDSIVKAFCNFNRIIFVLNLLGFALHFVGSSVMFANDKKYGFFTVFKHTLIIIINFSMLFMKNFYDEKRTSFSITLFKLMIRFVLAALFINLLFIISELVVFCNCHGFDNTGFANPHCVNPGFPKETLPNFGFLWSLTGSTLSTCSLFLFFILINNQ